MENQDMNPIELINIQLKQYTDLQRIYRANNGHPNEELLIQLKECRAVLQSLGILLDDITFIDCF